MLFVLVNQHLPVAVRRIYKEQGCQAEALQVDVSSGDEIQLLVKNS